MTDWLVPMLAGALTGILSGFGIGGGSLLLIYMTSFAGLPQDLAQGINLLYFLPTAGAALPAGRGCPGTSCLCPKRVCRV